MTWAWVRPADHSVLEGRPLLDLGTGDGQTLKALAPDGFVVGLDRALDALGATRKLGIDRLVCAVGDRLPFRDATFGCILAGDVFHHTDDDRLCRLLSEVGRTLRDDGVLVAWWYREPGREMVGGPKFPRAFDAVAAHAAGAGFEPSELELEASLDGPATVGLVARPNRAESTS